MSDPYISIVTGTYNRRESLVRMIESARRTIPRGLSYEFVVVDGGSTDGTLEWAKQQPDIYLIRHGELRGAIRAFCDGARAARGEYVLLANDDISFQPYSILAAIAHLERTPTCGQVAFADNRYSLLHGNGQQYRVEGVGATLHDGKEVMVAYAQVSLTPKWLGDKVGWWGDTDPIMSKARTYGGDNYLSAGIWELGFTVDAVPQAKVEDHIHRDTLRADNQEREPKPSPYYERYPTVRIPMKRAIVPPSDRLRILNLPIYEFNYPGRYNRELGLTEALADYGLAIEWDIFNEPIDVIELVKAWQPDLLVTQIQGPGKITPYILASCRNVAPGMLIVNWNGDAHERGLLGDDVLELLRYVDLQTVVNVKVLPEYEKFGIRAAFWEIGFKDPVGDTPIAPEYEVLFSGNCYDDRRTEMVKMLRSMRLTPSARHPQVGIYGNCEYSDGNSHYSFAMQRALYSRAIINVGDTYPGTRAFVSNRLFQVLSAGGFLLQQYSEDLDKFTGLIPGEHYIEWGDLKDLETKIDYWLKPEHTDERKRIAASGCAFVRENFSYSAQARKLFQDLLPMIEVEHVSA